MKIKVIVDAFGGDNAPLEILKGCRYAIDELDCEIILSGNREIIKKISNENKISLNGMSIVHTTDIITMEDEASIILKEKRNSSMAKGLELLKDGAGSAFVSAGNSGALLMGATFINKRIASIKRPAFAPLIPKYNGYFLLIDSGANVDCRPEILEQFALMGSIYLKHMLNIAKPRVGLANIGIEEHKGGTLQQETYKLLKQNPTINFVGNIEAREIPMDAADVVVTDGFTGNMILKTYEGVAISLITKFKEIFSLNFKTKIAAALISKELKQFKNNLSSSEQGGAPILGVKQAVYKSHGNADAKAIKNAIASAIKYSQSKIIENMEIK